jgi:exo-1,4-beta-D-glucosaminidase
VNIFTDGLNRRYGKATSLDDYERKAQAVAYDGQRAMFEAYGRNKYIATGVIQWMLNNAWPSLIWHLYDYYLVPAGGYFGTKKACEPVHVQYSYDDNSVAVVNGTYEQLKGMKVSAKIYNLDAKEKASREATIDLSPDSSSRVFELPTVDGLTKTYFLRLQLRGAEGKPVSDNFYWLSTKLDVLDWAKKKDTVYTPQSEFGDLTGLNGLPQVQLEVQAVNLAEAGRGVTQVRVRNPSNTLAFMVHLKITREKGGEEVTPILWEDNYFSLLPGEQREVTARYDVSALEGKGAVLALDGFNSAAQSVSMSPPR